MATLGFQGEIYRNTASEVSPTWSAVNLVGNAQVNPKYGEGDATARASNGVTETEPVLLGVEITGSIRKKNGDTNYAAFRAAFFARTALNLLVLDGKIATEGAQGVKGNFKVFDWSEDQSLNNVVFNSFTLKPCADSNLVLADSDGTNVTFTNLDGTSI